MSRIHNEASLTRSPGGLLRPLSIVSTVSSPRVACGGPICNDEGDDRRLAHHGFRSHRSYTHTPTHPIWNATIANKIPTATSNRVLVRSARSSASVHHTSGKRARESEVDVDSGSDSDGAVAADGEVPRWSAPPVRRIWSNLWVSMADHGAFNATNWHDSLGTAHVCKSQFPHCPGTTSRRALTAVAHHGRLWSALVHWVYITAL